MRMTLADVAAATGGRRQGDAATDAVIDGVSIDSRSVQPGELFVALVAERDGHDFASAAVEAGAGAVVVQRDIELPAQVVVPDTASALTEIGSLARGRLPDTIVAITGSVGKTSCKDLCAGAMGSHLRVAASARSFNNELGVPITLASAPDDTEAVIVEMGARGRGHIAELCAVARPTVGVITRVALAHAEQFGSVDEVAMAKGELVESLPASGTAVLNADDAVVVAMADRTDAAVLTYGSAPTADVRVEGVVLDEDLRPSFSLRSPWGDGSASLEARGAHNVANAAAAAAAALVCDVPLAAVLTGLGSASLSPWRMELGRASSGARVLNDAYNANATSCLAALDALAAIDADRRVAVLGELAELGASAAAEHQAVRAHADALGIEVIAVDTPAYGAPVVADVEGALAALGPLQASDAVLVKGSRVAGLEVLAEQLLGPG